MRKRVAIIGGGIFGSIAAILAMRKGHTVTIFDDAKLMKRATGSAPAACLIKPGWISGLGDAGKTGLEVLRKNFAVSDIQFRIGPATTTVHWVNPKDIRQQAERVAFIQHGTVLSVSAKGFVVYENMERAIGGRESFDAILVAAGVWSRLIVLDMPEIRALAGIAFTFGGERAAPIIAPWAPYKQVVAFTREPGTTWISDGSAILEKNWTERRAAKCLDRCAHYAQSSALFAVTPTKTQFGLRPYVVDHKQGYFARVADRTWVSTGGAKNGTVLAAYQALKFVEAIK